MPIQGVSRDQALDQLERVLSSAGFQGAARSRALLKFLVEESVADRTDRLKEYTIGVEALGKGDAFDPRTDPIVRAEASRLRSRLERYYASEGGGDPVAIVLPKGAMSRGLKLGSKRPNAPQRRLPNERRHAPRLAIDGCGSLPVSQRARRSRFGCGSVHLPSRINATPCSSKSSCSRMGRWPLTSAPMS